MGRPLNKRNFGNVTDPGPQLQCYADIGGGEELCWIQSQRGTNKFNLASIAGGATPTREGIARLANEAVGAVSLNNMVVTVQVAAGATGTGETLTASMEADAVSINAIGAGYAVGDTITLTGGTGTDAIIDVDTLSTIAAQDELDFNNVGANGTFVGGDGAGGTAYIAAETITLNDGTVITVDSVDGNDDVLTFTVTSASTTGFIGVGTTLTQASTSGTGTGFTLTMDTNNQGVFGVSVNTAGAYTVLPTNPVSQGATSGIGAGATIDIDGYAVESVAVGAGGSGFTTEPDIAFTGGGGTGASATSTLTGDAINTVVMVSGGSGYTSIPTVSATQVTEEIAARIHGHKVYTFSGNGYVWVLGTDAGSIVADFALPLIEAEVQFDGE